MSERVFPAAVILPLGAYYLLCACPFVLGADNGEFATLYAEGGVAHPPGYPLYILYLRALHCLPTGTPALGAARATALLGVAALALLYLACRAWGASRPAATAACAIFGLSRVVCEQLTQAEAFALNIVLCSAFLAAAGESSRLRGGARLVALGAVTGLGASHHHTLATLAPVGIVAALRAFRLEEARLKHLGLAVLAFVAGLSPYAYSMTVARHPDGRWIWGRPVDGAGLLHMFFRVDYLAERGSPRASWQQVQAVSETLARAFYVVGLVFVVAGAARLILRRRGAGWLPRADGIALVASAAIAGPGLVSRFWGTTLGTGLALSERFHVLPVLLASVAFAVGADELLRGRARQWAWMIPGIAFVTVAHILFVRPTLRENERPTVDRYLRNTLRSLPEGAVVLGVSDVRFFGFLYMQHAVGLRRDVVYVDIGMMDLDWYRTDKCAASGVFDGGVFDIAVFAASVLTAGRPLFFAASLPREMQPSGYDTVPYGTVFRIVPRGEPVPPIEAIEATNISLARTFEWDETKLEDPWTWAGIAEDDYAATWRAIGAAYAARGRVDGAERNFERAVRGVRGP